VSFWTKGFAAEAAKKLENFGFIQLRPGGTVLLHSHPHVELFMTNQLIPSIAVEGVRLTMRTLWNILGEYHGNNPEMSKLLHKAVREKNQSAFAVYQEHLSNRPVNVRPHLSLLLLSRM
jgi:glutamate synthase (ferredoxin)